MSNDAHIITEIVDQYIDMVPFLWTQRNRAIDAPYYSLKDLSDLDDRLEAHIDGLRVAGDPGWDLCEAALEEDDPGLVFAAGVLAFENFDGERIDTVVSQGSRSRANFQGMVSALGWLTDQQFSEVVASFLRANSNQYLRLAIAGCGIRRFDPGDALTQAVGSEDLFLRRRALIAVGELKRQDLLSELSRNRQHENYSCRLAAAISMLLLGDKSALDTIGQFVLAQSPFRVSSMKVALRAADLRTSQSWLKSLVAEPDTMRDMLIGAGITGDPVYVPTLIKCMDDPDLARVAGGAFSMITGIDLAYEDLDGDWPEGFESGPDDDPEDENVDMDADEDLPWPDKELISERWRKIKVDFASGTRYLAGKPITSEHCVAVMKNGMQGQRNAAALELALMQPDRPYFNTAAPGFRQEGAL